MTTTPTSKRDKARELARTLSDNDPEALNLCRTVWRSYQMAGLTLIEKNPELRGRKIVTEAAANGGIDKLIESLKPKADELEDTEADKLAKDCCQVRISWQWFRTSSKVDKAAKTQMADAASTTESAFSASKRLMDSKHPVVKEANDARTRIQSFIRGISLPVLRIGGADAGSKKDGGNYLVRWQDVSLLHQKLTAAQSELATLEDKVNRNLESIKEMDRARLKHLFRESDYGQRIRLRMHYQTMNFEPSAILQREDPAFFAAERARVRSMFTAVYTDAVTEFFGEFQAVISSWVNVLGPVITLYPPVDHPMARLSGASIIRTYDHKDDAVIPEGSLKILIRQKVGDSWVDETIGPITDVQYAELRPAEEAGKHRRFQPSTIENLMEVVNKFSRLSETISASPAMKEVSAKVAAQIKRLGDKPEDVVKELRNSTALRNETRNLMTEIDRAMSQEINLFQKKRRAAVFVGTLDVKEPAV